MTLDLEFPEELAVWVRRSAARSGLDERSFVISALEQQRRTHEDLVDAQSGDETELLEEIGKGLPEAKYRRYRDLVTRSEQEKLTSPEHKELLELIDLVEWDNAERLARVAKLAKLRGVSLSEMMQELELLHSSA